MSEPHQVIFAVTTQQLQAKTWDVLLAASAVAAGSSKELFLRVTPGDPRQTFVVKFGNKDILTTHHFEVAVGLFNTVNENLKLPVV